MWSYAVWYKRKGLGRIFYLEAERNSYLRILQSELYLRSIAAQKGSQANWRKIHYHLLKGITPNPSPKKSNLIFHTILSWSLLLLRPLDLPLLPFLGLGPGIEEDIYGFYFRASFQFIHYFCLECAGTSLYAIYIDTAHSAPMDTKLCYDHSIMWRLPRSV
jgi:hypothetical protein